MRIRILIDPHFLAFKSDGVDYQRILVPLSDLFSKERRVGVVGMLSIRVDGDQSVIAIEIEKGDLMSALQNFKRKAAGVVARNPTDDAEAFRIDGRSEVVLQSRLACRRQRKLEARKVFPDVASRLSGFG